VESLVRVQPLDCDFSLEAPERNRDWYEVRGYEPASTALFRTVATGADVILDIGAHMGYYSLLGASAAPGATVVAVEASPENAEALRRNVAESSGVRVVNAAFAAAPGTATIQLTEASDNSGFSGHPNSPTERSVEVPAVSVDELGLPAGDRLVVKLDVEGHELAALTGLQAVFQRFSDVRLLVEMNPKCLTLAGSSADELIERLRGLGLRLFVIDEDTRSWHELRPGSDWRDLVDVARYANLYCVSAERSRTVSAVLHSGGIGGAERSHAEMVESLVRQGSMVHTVIPEPDAGLGDALRRLGGSVTVVPPFAWWALWPHEEEEQPSGWTARNLVHEPLVRSLREIGPDVVLTQSGVIPQGAIAAAALRTPHIWYLREFGDLDHGLVMPRSFGATVRALSARVVTNSAAVRDHHVVGNVEGVTVLHPAPVLPGAPQHAQAAPEPRGTRPWTLGVVGSLNPGKGQVDAVEAVALLRSQGVDVPLVLVGPGTDQDRDRLTHRVAELGITQLVDIAGPSDVRSEVYARFDAVAVTSRAEAFGRVPFEAAAAGLPIIYAAAGGPAEYLSDGVTGLAYTPENPADLAASILRLREEPEKAGALVAAAQEVLLGKARRQEYDDAVRRLIAEVADRDEPNGVRDLLGAAARETVANADEADLWRGEVTTVRADFRRVIQDHEDLVSRFRELEAGYTELLNGHHGVVAALDAERAELGRSRAANAMLRSELGDARDETAHAQADVVELQERLAVLEQEHAAVVGSRTWRYRQRAARLLRRA
jgi:FkbM family methyltransferase